MDFKHFPDIEGFHVAVKSGEYFGFPTVHYRGKIKLHGTNAGVRIKDGEVVAQSRTQLITPTSDNAGFAKWVETRKDWFKNLPYGDRVGSSNIAIFGEWCGPGIMKGTAINQIPHKAFCVFAVMGFVGATDDDAVVLVEPTEIEKLFVNKPEDVYVLPWCCEPLRVEFGNREQLQGVADHLNKYVEEIEPCDPWVKATFGVEGTAEGAVYYPVEAGKTTIRRKWFSDFVFKAKGEKHKVVKTKQAVQVDPAVAKSIDEFVTLFVTEPRLEQGLTNTGPADMKNTGAFLKWFCQDVQKESTTELEASNLTWDQVAKAVQIAAREWYKSKAMAIA